MHNQLGIAVVNPMRTFLALVAVVFCLPAFAAAQAHPCDDPSSVNPTIQTNGPIAVAFCQSSLDAEGNPVAIIGFRVVIDGVDRFTGSLAPVGAPNAAGLSYYETPKTITLAKGVHSAVVYTAGVDGESAGSDPFAFTLKGVPPGKGVIKKIIK